MRMTRDIFDGLRIPSAGTTISVAEVLSVWHRDRSHTAVFRWQSDLPAACLVAIGLVAAATLVRIAIGPLIAGWQFPTFFLAVITSTFLGGVGIGLLSVLLSTLSAWLFVLPPQFSFALPNLDETYALLTFVLVATLEVFIVGSLQATICAIKDGRHREAMLEECTYVAQELRRWADAFRNVGVGVSIVDPTSKIIQFANAAFAAMHGLSVENVQGMSMFDLYPPADWGYIATLQDNADRVGEIEYQAERIHSNGGTFPAQIHVTSVREADAEVCYRIVTVQDLTSQRQLEAELRQAQQMEAIGQLTAGVAHDFGNLLQAIMSSLERLNDHIPNGSGAREYVDSALRIAERGGELTQHLLSFARKQILRPRAIDLGRFLAELHDLLSHTLDPRIRIETVTEPGLTPVWVDATYLQTALLNLAINARDAMPLGGDLRVEALNCHTATVAREGLDHFAVIRVSDTGTGIAPAIMAKVCEPFFTTKGLNGTGLGLSMVHGFTKQSGGDLLIESEPGKGTCVQLWLPLTAVAGPGAIR